MGGENGISASSLEYKEAIMRDQRLRSLSDFQTHAHTHMNTYIYMSTHSRLILLIVYLAGHGGTCL